MIARLLISLIAGLAIVGGHYPKDTRHAEKAGATQATPRTIEKSFRLFQSNAEALPDSVRSRLARLLTEPNEPFNPSEVQRSHTKAGIVWAFVVGDQVCLAQGSHGASACVAMSIATSEGVSLGTFSPPSKRIHRPHHFMVLGLVPDGIGRIELRIGKQRKTAAVKNNLYSASADQPIFVRRLIHETG